MGTEPMGDTCQDCQAGPGSPCTLAVGEGQPHLSSHTSSEASRPPKLLQGLSDPPLTLLPTARPELKSFFFLTFPALPVPPLEAPFVSMDWS